MSMSRGYQLTNDVVTSATGGGALRIDNLLDFNINIIQLIIGNASTLVEGNTISSAIFAKINLLHFGSFNLVPWMVQKLALSTYGGEMFFQIVITLAEVIVGLMLLGGFFTFPAAAVSLGLMAMFVTSTGLYLDSWWMVFASIVCLGGAGRGFGLDYYVIPWFTRAWEYFWKNRRIKLFFSTKNSRE
jgi:NADH dehydrogenase